MRGPLELIRWFSYYMPPVLVVTENVKLLISPSNRNLESLPVHVKLLHRRRGSLLESRIQRDSLERRCIKAALLPSTAEKRDILWLSKASGKRKLVRAIENWP